MSRVLVTGGTGFVGRPIVAALLAAGCDVHVAGRRDPGLPGVVHHGVDLLRPGAEDVLRQGFDVVVHAAWTVEHGRFWTAPDNLDWVAATLTLARAAAATGTRRFVGVGTCAEYDWQHEPGRPRRETDPLGASHLYGEAKASTGRLLGRAFSDGPMQVAWARLFFPFGPGEPEAKLLPSLVAAMRAGEPFTLRNGALVRDFIAVEDAGAAIAALALSGVTGPVNVASGEPISVRAFAEHVRLLAGERGTLLDAPASGQGEPAVVTADVSRLHEEVGWTPPVALRVRISEFLRATPPPSGRRRAERGNIA